MSFTLLFQSKVDLICITQSIQWIKGMKKVVLPSAFTHGLAQNLRVLLDSWQRTEKEPYLLSPIQNYQAFKLLSLNVQRVLKMTMSDWSETFLFLARPDTVESPFKEISVFIRPQEYGKTAQRKFSSGKRLKNFVLSLTFWVDTCLRRANRQKKFLIAVFIRIPSGSHIRGDRDCTVIFV